MAGSFPSGITTYTNPGPTDATATAIGGRSHDQFHADNNDDLEQVMTKLGTGASTAAANTVLRGTGSGVTAFGQIVSGDITDDTLTNADINSAAAIAVTKLAHVGTGNVLRSNGTTNAAGQIVSGDITDGTIVSGDLAIGAASSTVAAVPTTSYPTTTSAVMSDMPQMTVTLTTLGRPVLILFSASTYHSVNNAGANYELYQDGGLQAAFSDSHGVATLFATTTYAILLTPSAASHTWKIMWANPAGGTLTNSSISRQLIAVELRR